jgi:hypothetical protein
MRKSGPYRRYRVSNFGVPVCSDLHGNRMRQNFCSALALPYNRRCPTCRPCLHFPLSLVAHIYPCYFRHRIRPENCEGVRGPAPPPPLPGCKTSTPPPLAGAAKKLSPTHIPARRKAPVPLQATNKPRIAKPPGYCPKVLKAQHLRITSGAIENDGAQSKASITPDTGEQNPIIRPDDNEASMKQRDKEAAPSPPEVCAPNNSGSSLG